MSSSIKLTFKVKQTLFLFETYRRWEPHATSFFFAFFCFLDQTRLDQSMAEEQEERIDPSTVTNISSGMILFALIIFHAIENDEKR